MLLVIYRFPPAHSTRTQLMLAASKSRGGASATESGRRTRGLTLVEGLKVLPDFILRHLRRSYARPVVQRVVEHVLNDHGLAELRLDVLSRAPLSVPTCSNLEVERAVD